MTTTNPLLSDGIFPAFSAIRPEHVVPAVQARIEHARAVVQRCCTLTGTPSFAALIAPLEAAEDAISRSWSPVSHLHSVCDNPALRTAHAEGEELLTAYHSELGQHRPLYEAMRTLRGSAEFAGLERAERSLIEHSLRDFELSGVALEEPARTRFRAIQQTLSRLTTEFEEAVLDASDAWSREARAEDLAGLPESARAMLAAAAREKGVGDYLIKLKHPHVQAVLSYAENRALREEVYTAYQTRASDQGPHAHRFDNSARMREILAFRQEAAGLLGFASAAELSLAEKMAERPSDVLDFLRDLGRRARPTAQREWTELQEFAAAQLGLADLQPWDVGFASERLRQQLFAFSEEDLRPYFPLPAVLEGMLEVASQLFGVRFAPRAGVDSWHPDVRFFDVLDTQGQPIAGFYLDSYAREAKRGGAWMDVCQNRFGAGERRPIAYLTCNFAPPVDARPALLTHDDVITLFHEFGHGLHHMLTEVRWPGVGGINGVEWDAVELPSQFMENFCWQRETLDRFARHVDDGSRLPDELLARMHAARHFHAGLFLLRQVEFGLFDFLLHAAPAGAAMSDPLELLERVRDEVAIVRPPSWQRFPHAFTHIFSGGYAAGYYSYLWAEVLSADAFGAFEEAGLLDAATGRRFRAEVLAVGGSRPALESFVAFRGRPPESDALLRSYGLAA